MNSSVPTVEQVSEQGRSAENYGRSERHGRTPTLRGGVGWCMTSGEKDEAREKRIRNEIVVDAYDRHERAIGWYTYLDDRLRFPFQAQCIAEREVSPLKEGEQVRVVGMSSVEASEHEMFVTIEWMDRELGVPLAQLEPLDVDSETAQAVADWHYWDEQGYVF